MSAETVTRAPADALPPRLRWLKPSDEYHTRSECGRFTVARRRVSGVDWYIAYRREPQKRRSVREQPHVAAIELGATQVSLRATDAERSAAIRAMKEICEAAA